MSAQRDPEQSNPDEPVWILACANPTYRVRLVPNMAARRRDTRQLSLF
jgi:hypothetical protein